jgi:glycosyltransferase involved in cell wall biosynthesis
MKKRILWITEASFLNTGFSVLSLEILMRLHKTGKYDIAELGSYAKTSDPRAAHVPWEFFGGIPEDNDQLGKSRYNSSQTGQFGEAVFEQVCLEFKPDIVIDVRDWWMCEFQLRSPFRPYYKLLWMPTVDGEPQRLEWLDDYSRTDMILTYSQYGKDVLEREAPGKIKVFDVVRPGANTDIYKPMDKAEVRKSLGLDPDINVIMTVMRNQRRKLFPDLCDAFADFLKYCTENNNEKLAKNTYLYLHTSYPDVGFDLPKHIMRNGIGHRTLVTYVCQNCHNYYADFFQMELTTCKHCGKVAAHMANTQHGVDRYQLARITNAADIYVQYSICEGLGLPICEAKSCGVPALAVDYSAMSEQMHCLGCAPIKVEKFFYESVIETEQKRALPSNKDTVKKLYKFFCTPKETRSAFSDACRKDIIDNYSFDRSAKVFERAIDSLDVVDHKDTWDNPQPRHAPMRSDFPQNMTNTTLVDWSINNILGRPDLLNTYWRNTLVRGLNVGFMLGKMSRENMNPDALVKMLRDIAGQQNFWENIRIREMYPEERKLTWEVV